MMNKSRPVHLSVGEIDATFQVDSIMKFYPEHVKLFVYRQPTRKLKDGYELRDIDKNRSTNSTKTNTESNLERSLRRTITNINDYVHCNNFELFVTFTFNSNRLDMEEKRSQLRGWLKNQQKRYGQFEYIIVMELHKDGAPHFHALLKNYKGKLKPSYSSKTGKPLTKRGNQIYELPSYTLGFTNVQIIKDKNSQLIASYLTKYITKDMPIIPNMNRFWVSGRLSSPLTAYNMPAWVYDEVPVFTHSSEYGTTYIIPYSERLTEFRKLNALPGGETLL